MSSARPICACAGVAVKNADSGTEEKTVRVTKRQFDCLLRVFVFMAGILFQSASDCVLDAPARILLGGGITAVTPLRLEAEALAASAETGPFAGWFCVSGCPPH